MCSFKLTVLAALSVLAFVGHLTLAEYVDDAEGAQYIVEQNHLDGYRHRRSPQVAISLLPLGAVVRRNLLKTPKSNLDGTAYYQRNFGSGVPRYQAGVGLNFNRNNAYGSVNYDRVPGASNLEARAGYKLWQSRDGMSNLRAEAIYDRRTGGYGSTNYG